jgi:hypothetical protein
MSEPAWTPLQEAKDSLQRVLRAYRNQASILDNGHTGNMDAQAIDRCIRLDTIGQLRRRVRKLSGR